MTNQEAIGVLESISAKTDYFLIADDARSEALDMAISALQAQELNQEVKKSRCTYKSDCPWYDGSKCNSPNDHGYHECDYDRGIFPESYEENVENSTKSSLTQKALDTISRQAAIDEVVTWLKDRMTDGKNGKPLTDRLKDLPSAQPDWNEMIVMCDCCGHAIHVKRIEAERREDEKTERS